MSDAPAGARGSGPPLLRLLAGKWLAAAVGAAAQLGVADVLSDGPRSCDELAGTLGCQPQLLARLMRALSAEGLFERAHDGRYRLTQDGEALKSGALRDLAIYTVMPSMWDAWSELPAAIRQGRSAFGIKHGSELFDFLDRHPVDSRLYQAAIDAFTRHEARALGDAFCFDEARSVVDVGGGVATLLIELLQAHPHLVGTLVERPTVIAQAQTRVEAAGLTERLTLHPGNFFEALPAGGDVYVLMHTVHNWDDEPAVRLLENCAAAMPQEGRLLVIDGFLLPGDIKDGTALLDLEMLALGGHGRERTKPEFRQLLGRAGLKLVASPSLAGTTRLLICERKA